MYSSRKPQHGMHTAAQRIESQCATDRRAPPPPKPDSSRLSNSRCCHVRDAPLVEPARAFLVHDDCGLDCPSVSHMPAATTSTTALAAAPATAPATAT